MEGDIPAAPQPLELSRKRSSRSPGDRRSAHKKNRMDREVSEASVYDDEYDDDDDDNDNDDGDNDDVDDDNTDNDDGHADNDDRSKRKTVRNDDDNRGGAVHGSSATSRPSTHIEHPSSPPPPEEPVFSPVAATEEDVGDLVWAEYPVATDGHTYLARLKSMTKRAYKVRD